MAKFDYVFYEMDESFDYGQGTCYQKSSHGFTVEMDKEDNINLESLKGFGDYDVEVSKIKTYTDLLNFLEKHLDEVQEDEYHSEISNLECFKELIDFVRINITRENLKNLDFRGKISYLLDNLMATHEQFNKDLSDSDLKRLFISEIEQYI